MKKTLLLLVAVVLIVFGMVVYGANRQYKIPGQTAATSTLSTSTLTSTSNAVSFVCANTKTMAASFSANDMSLSLSDGRQLSLVQAVSGSGIRYTNASDTIEFRGEGSNAYLTEGASTTYDQCISATVTPVGKDSENFTESSKTFSFNYPAGLQISGGEIGYTKNWSYEATTSGQVLAMVTITKDYEPQSNFTDAKFTVGTSADPQAVSFCTTPAHGSVASSTQVIINGVPFTKISLEDAGAGNYYMTTSYRTVRNNQCYAVEYTIHSTMQGGNKFDPTTVQNTLESIVQSFKFL